MKKIIALFIILATTMSVNSQITKGDYSISVTGNYSKGSNSSGVSTNSFTTTGENINASISVEHYKMSNFYIGLGFDFHWGNDNIFNSLSSKNFTQYENMKVKSFLIFPNIIYGYYLPITDNLFFNLSARVGYGVLGYDYNSDYKNYQHPNGGTLAQTTTANEDLKWGSNDYFKDFGASLSPEINYFLSDNFGLCLRLGGIDYSILDWNKDQSSFNVNFNPNNWRLGIRFIL